MKKIFILAIIIIGFSSCTVVKEYEKVYLNDEEMKLTAKTLEQFDVNFQVYREAAAGANGGKTGGGCGCN